MKDVYVILKEYVKFKDGQNVYLGDISNIYADIEYKKKIEKIEIQSSNKDLYSVDILEIIDLIKKVYQDTNIISLGENETVICFEKEKNKVMDEIKKSVEIIIGTLILLCGTFVAIMTFHEDTSLSGTHNQIYKLFVGEESRRPYVIQIPYSIGIAVGAIVFFTKFKNKSITPLDVEIKKYETDIVKAEVKNLNKEE